MINNINPIIFQYNFISVRWYGIFLVIGIILSLFIITKLFKQNNLNKELAYDLVVWLTIGGLIGARLGHIIFYNLSYFLSNPAEIIMINHGGLSSHGMTIGLIITFLIFVKVKHLTPDPSRDNLTPNPSPCKGEGDWRKIVDLIVIPIPLLASFIRLGNFFNSEIVGRPTDLPWGVYFPRFELEPILRHPSQIYESLISLSLFISIYFIYKKYYHKLPQLFLTNLFILTYFSTRFLIEFVKEYPLYFGLTTGQWLSLPFVLWGVIWFLYYYQKKKQN
ncbi:prolipoprotein diacylglyceryl transferase [Patescibacteria group bacterium]|nr:prolipoprotein diacylglyceryl transferase [Patescibacteria group bacterium]